MHKVLKSSSLVLALTLLGGSSFAAVVPDSSETVTVTGQQPGIELQKGDLDPMKDHFDGLTGEKISRDIDRLDRTDAFREFARGLTGPLGQTYDWHGLRDDGQFRPTREFYEAGLLCRDFTEETNHHGLESPVPQNTATDVRQPIILGTACRERDGWHFR
jgi:hypothetical protein